jgi:hypothetical protein
MRQPIIGILPITGSYPFSSSQPSSLDTLLLEQKHIEKHAEGGVEYIQGNGSNKSGAFDVTWIFHLWIRSHIFSYHFIFPSSLIVTSKPPVPSSTDT